MDSASCVCFFSSFVSYFTGAGAGAAREGYRYRDTRSRSEAYDMGDSDMEIRERILYLASHGLLVVSFNLFLFSVHF